MGRPPLKPQVFHASFRYRAKSWTKPRRVVAKGLDPKETPIADVMTENPETLSPDDSAGDALEMMLSRHFRHLPVIDGEKCVGMVSIRDLYKAAKSSLEESIKETEAFVFGDRYGA